MLDKLGTVEMFADLSMETKDWASPMRIPRAARRFQKRARRFSEEALAELVAPHRPRTPGSWIPRSRKLTLYVGDRKGIENADVAANLRAEQAGTSFSRWRMRWATANLAVLLRRLDEELWTCSSTKTSRKSDCFTA